MGNNVGCLNLAAYLQKQGQHESNSLTTKAKKVVGLSLPVLLDQAKYVLPEHPSKVAADERP